MIQLKICLIARRTTEQGFTLIEVLMAMAVFAIGILAVFSMQMTSISSNASARKVTENYTWAMDKTEQLLNLPYTDAQLFSGVHSVAAGSFSQATDGIDNDNDGQIDEVGETGHINIQWTVQDNFPVSNVKSIRVTVTQKDALRRTKTVNIDFIKANI